MGRDLMAAFPNLTTPVSHGVRELFDSYGFPTRVFSAQGIYLDWDDESDDENDSDDEDDPFA